MGREKAESLIRWYAWQQAMYEEGEPSVWGWWNRMAEYLLKGNRRFRP